MGMTRRLVLIACSVVILGAAGSFAVARWLTDLRYGAPADCVESIDLQPFSRGGGPWSEHRHWLEMPVLYKGGPDGYAIHNRRTGETFRWSARPDEAHGRTRFPVLTRYAEIRNRHWQDDPWSFCRLPATTPSGEDAPAGP